MNFGAVAAADPVALHRLDGVGPVEQFEVVDETVGVGGDAHHPLAHVALEHREVAAVAAPIGGDLLVGDHGAQTGAPVDRCLTDVREPAIVDDVGALVGGQLGPRSAVGGGARARLEFGDQFGDRTCPVEVVVVPGVEDLAEDPLCPAVELGVGGRHAAARVVGQAQTAQLATVGGNVLGGGDCRVLAGFDGELLGGQAECVEAHGVQHVVAGHPLEPGEHVCADEAQRVPDVQPRARWVREHVEHEQLLAALVGEFGVGEWAGGVGRLEGVMVVPPVLPAQFDVLRELRRVPMRRGVVHVAHTGGPAYASSIGSVVVPSALGAGNHDLVAGWLRSQR